MAPWARARLALLLPWLATGAFAGAETRWDTTGPIPVFIQPYASRGPELVRRALQAWSDASQGSLVFKETAKPEQAALRIFFVDEAAKFGEAAPRVDRRSGRIAAAEVMVQGDPVGDPLAKQIVVYLTALHEIGHALGLSHSDDFSSIMYRFRSPSDPARYFLRYRESLRSAEEIGSPGASGLSARDREALGRLYGP